MAETTLESNYFPVNELGEIVLTTGSGSTNIAGFMPSNLVPTDPRTGRVKAVFGAAATETASVGNDLTYYVKEGTSVKFVSNSAIGTITKYKNDGSVDFVQAVVAGNIFSYGPYSGAQKFVATVSVGSIDASVGDAVLGSVQVAADGRMTIPSNTASIPSQWISRASSVMWLGDSITATSNAMPHTPQNRATRILYPAYTNINSGGLFVIMTESGPTTAAGNGTLTYYAAEDAFGWAANGDTEGPHVKVPTAGFYTLESATVGNTLYLGVVSRNKPVVNKSDTINVTGSFRLRNNTASNGMMGFSQLLLGTPFSTSLCYAIPTIKASEWWAARAQWQGIYTDTTPIFLGTNDVNDLATAAQALIDIENIAKLRQSIGSRVILGCLMPYDARTTAQTQAAIQFNLGLRDMAARINADIWDAWPYLASASGTGGYATNMAWDVPGLHPSALGGYMVGSKCIVPILSKYTINTMPQQFAGASYNATTAPYGNLLTNGQLLGVAGVLGAGVTGEVPTSWNCGRSIGTNITAVSKAPDSASPVLRTDGKQGKYWSVAISNSAGADGESILCRASAFTTSGFAAGDYFVIEGDLRLQGTGIIWLEVSGHVQGGVGARENLAIYDDTTPSKAMYGLNGDVITVPFRSKPMMIEAGDTQIIPWITVGMKAGGTAQLDIGQNISLHKVPAP